MSLFTVLGPSCCLVAAILTLVMYPEPRRGLG
jgi:hypothetical protein